MKEPEDDLRARLVALALEWQARYSVAPHITNAISEYDAALLVGHSPESYSRDCMGRTAVTRGADFSHNGLRYQVKGSRPSGSRGSAVSKLGKAANYEWDRLLWLLYDVRYNLLEVWEWEVGAYRDAFDAQVTIRPPDMRLGHCLFTRASSVAGEPNTLRS